MRIHPLGRHHYQRGVITLGDKSTKDLAFLSNVLGQVNPDDFPRLQKYLPSLTKWHQPVESKLIPTEKERFKTLLGKLTSTEKIPAEHLDIFLRSILLFKNTGKSVDEGTINSHAESFIKNQYPLSWSIKHPFSKKLSKETLQAWLKELFISNHTQPAATIQSAKPETKIEEPVLTALPVSDPQKAVVNLTPKPQAKPAYSEILALQQKYFPGQNQDVEKLITILKQRGANDEKIRIILDTIYECNRQFQVQNAITLESKLKTAEDVCKEKADSTVPFDKLRPTVRFFFSPAKQPTKSAAVTK